MEPISLLVLVDAGPNRLEVTRRVRQLLDLSIKQASDLVQEGNLILFEGSGPALFSLSCEFKDLGATIDVRPKV